MSNSNSDALTKEQLFACLEHCLTLDDKLGVNEVTINRAKNNDGESFRLIGYEYESKLQDYSKAMAWYQLGTEQHSLDAYNNIGCLYHLGNGVSQSYLTAIEYYLKGARGNQKAAMSNIGMLFSIGLGVPLDKYKALEWLTKSGLEAKEAEQLNREGIHLKKEDKNKNICRLANETDEILREVRMERESRLMEEIKELKTKKSESIKENEELQQMQLSNEQEIQRLQNELKQQTVLLESSNQLVSNLEQRLMDKTDIINLLKGEGNIYQAFLQSKNNEIDLLKKGINLEQENLELKRKLERYSKEASIDNSDNNAADSSAQLDSQTPLSDIPTHNLDNIRVKIEAEPENGVSLGCQIANKKRKMSPNDS